MGGGVTGDRLKIFMEDAILVGGRAYFFSKDWNALYAADLESGETALVGVMPEENLLDARLCVGILHYDGKLLLVPMTARKIWIYDLEKGSWEGLERVGARCGKSHGEMFRGFTYQKHFFLIGSNYPAVIRMDPKTYELEYWKEPYAFLQPIKYTPECYFRADYALVGKHLFLASCLSHHVLRLDLDTADYRWFEVGERGFRYSGIAWDGESFWLSPRTDTPIVKWDGKDRAEYFPLPDGFGNGRPLFSGVQYDGGKLVFPGFFQSRTLILHPDSPHGMEVQKRRYTFYRCFGTGGMLSQTADGMFRWKCLGTPGSGRMYCEASLQELLEKAGKSEFTLGNKVLTEGSPSMFLFYLSMLGSGNGSEHRESNRGGAIWEAIRS